MLGILGALGIGRRDGCPVGGAKFALVEAVGGEGGEQHRQGLGALGVAVRQVEALVAADNAKLGVHGLVGALLELSEQGGLEVGQALGDLVVGLLEREGDGAALRGGVRFGDDRLAIGRCRGSKIGLLHPNKRELGVVTPGFGQKHGEVGFLVLVVGDKRRAGWWRGWWA